MAIDLTHPPPDDDLQSLPILPGMQWAHPKTGEPLSWEQDGQTWELAITADEGEKVFSRQRHYVRAIRSCERGPGAKGHVAVPNRWPPPGIRQRVNGQVVETEGTIQVRCENCGAQLLVEAFHATEEGKRLPPQARINVVLPESDKKVKV